MKHIELPALVAVVLILILTGCGDDPVPAPDSRVTSTLTPAPTPVPTSSSSTAPDAEAEPPPIPPRIGAACDDLVSASDRENILGVADDDIEALEHPLADGSAAVLQAGVLTCRWTGPTLGGGAVVTMDIEVLPDAAAVFAAFVRPLGGTEVLGLLGSGSVIDCFAEAAERYCSLHYLSGSSWVEASFVGAAPVPASDPVAGAVAFAAAISDGLAAAGPLAPAYTPPTGFLPAWSGCGVVDAGAAFRSALASPSLSAPQPEFSGAGALFSEAWQRVHFKSCAWYQAGFATFTSSPAGQIRMVTVGILPGAEWAWERLRESSVDRGATELSVLGAEAALLRCSSDDDCTVEALVDGSYLSVYVGVDTGRGDAATRAETAAEFAISRL